MRLILELGMDREFAVWRSTIAAATSDVDLRDRGSPIPSRVASMVKHHGICALDPLSAALL